MHIQPVFKDAPFYGDGTSERLFDHGLCLPSGSNMTEEEQSRVIQNIVRAYRDKKAPLDNKSLAD
jgi:dTDP-4-amino-4,6-dideoxygalactose transaminase